MRGKNTNMFETMKPTPGAYVGTQAVDIFSVSPPGVLEDHRWPLRIADPKNPIPSDG